MRWEDVKETWLEKLQDEAKSRRSACGNLGERKTELEQHLEILKDFMSRVNHPVLVEETNKEFRKAQEDLVEIKTEEEKIKNRLVFVEALENYIRKER